MNKSKNKIIAMITALVVIGVIIGGAYAINAQFNDNSEQGTDGPETTVMNFYEEWLTYERNPMEDKIYENHPSLSTNLEEKLNTEMDSTEANYDPMTCGASTPQTVDIAYVNEQGDTANVGVIASSMEDETQMELMLIKENDSWVIDDITCSDQTMSSDLSQQNNQDRQMQERKDTVENYVRENIEDLAPQTGTTTEQTTFNDIRFVDNNNAIVSFTQGDKQHMAAMGFDVDENQNVQVNSFNVLDDRVVQILQAINFSEEGRLVQVGDGWQFSYNNESGNSVTVDLQFSAQTMCIQGSQGDANGEKQGMPCTQATLQDGDRVQVNGVRENGKVMVLYMSMQ